MNAAIPIDDPRLTADMERIRNGRMQLFRRNYGDRQFTDEKNADVVLCPPEKHIYAELIDGVWHWVNGCAECNGKPRDWMTYIECDKHNVCRSCGRSRDQLTEAPWGGKHGWQCKPCADAEHEEEKRAALAAMPEEHSPLDYMLESNPRCPYCDHALQIDGEDIDSMLGSPQTEECPRCDAAFTIEAEMTITYSTARIDQQEATT